MEPKEKKNRQEENKEKAKEYTKEYKKVAIPGSWFKRRKEMLLDPITSLSFESHPGLS